MSWITTITEGFTEPVERQVVIGDSITNGWFKRITAAQRQQLVQGQRVVTKDGKAEVEVDLGANEQTKHRLVFMSACNADGTPAFAHVKEVAALPAVVCNALFKIASELNRDPTEDEAGKA